MSFLENVFDRVSSIFRKGDDELLFFILVFFIRFTDHMTGSRFDGSDKNDSGFPLFFVILFLLLFFNNDFTNEIP